ADTASETDLDRSRRPGGQYADASKLRHPHDGSPWTATERKSAVGLSAGWLRLYARCTAQRLNRESWCCHLSAARIPLGRFGGGCYRVTMTGQPIAQIRPRKRRPQWIVPLVTALVFLAV